MKKFLAKILLFTLLFNLVPFTAVNDTFAAGDVDGTNNLDMTLTSSVDQDSIVGSNFLYNFNLKNNASSDGSAFENGFILSIPKNDISFVSADSSLGSPTRIIDNGTRKLYFFETDDFLLQGTSKDYSINLDSTNSAVVGQNYDIKVLAYADDSPYGRGPVPTGAPASANDGGVDLANSTNDPSDLTFPDNINSFTDLSSLPFKNSQTKFVPFNITKNGEEDSLIGNEYITNLKVKGNSLGDLNNFSIVDVIPNTRKFTGFVQTAGVGNVQVDYNTPSNGQVTLTLSDIDVPKGTDLDIKYNTLALAYPILSYSGSSILLNTGSVIHHSTESINTATQQMTGTWNDGVNDIPVDSNTIVGPKKFIANLLYAKLDKSVTAPNGIDNVEIGDLLNYTVSFNVAENVSFNTNGSGTYIEDILPDGLTFSGTVSSTNSGLGNALTYESSTVDADGNTRIIWKLNSGQINPGETVSVKYQALLDGQFEGAGPTDLVNLQSLENKASIFANVGDSGNNEEWGYTDPSIIDNQISYSSRDGNPAIAEVTTAKPINKKYILSIVEPDNTTYDSTTGMPTEGVDVGSEVEYALVMDFPNVDFSNVKIIDALPLLIGPNTEISGYSFVPIGTKDINNNTIEYNTEDKTSGNFNNTFNSLNLTSTGWISETPANNIEFDLGSGVGNKTFAIKFKAKILDVKPSSISNGNSGLKNVAFASFNDSVGSTTNLDIKKVKLNIGVPELELTKTMSGSNIEAGSNIEYNVEIKNIGKAPAYVENLIDTLPDNLDLKSYTITGSGFVIGSGSMTQSGNILSPSFDLSNGRSVVPENSSVIIDYIVSPNSGLIINNIAKTNKISLDYYATPTATSDGLHNYGPLEAESSFITKQPTITRTLISTSESGTGSGNDVEIGEEAYFETVIKLPGGVYNNSSFEFTENNNLDFLTGSIVSNSGSLNFSSGSTFSGSTATFGTLTNSDLDPNTTETIVFNSTFRPKIGASNGNKYTRGRFYYNSLNITKYKSIEVIQPNIIFGKTISPDHGDAGDIATVTLNMTNTGNASAYDLKLTDILDSRYTFNTGSLVLDGFTGSENDINSSTGILLDKLSVGETKNVTFDVIINQDFNPNDTIPNISNLSYSSLDDDSVGYEKNYSTSDNADYHLNNISISHSLISTSNPDTSTGFYSSLEDLSIGEHANYKTTLTIPESTFSGMIVTQNLPSGFKFLTGSVVLNGGITNSVSNVVINPDNTISYTLGKITNSEGNGDNTIDLLSELIVTDSAGIVDGSNKGLSTAIASWDGGNSVSDSTNLDIVEPNILINKIVNPLNAVGGDIVTYTVNLNNNGNGPAYNIKLSDIINDKFIFNTGSLVLNGFSGSESDFISSNGIILDKLLPSATGSINFDVTVKNSVIPNEIIGNTVNLDYSSSIEDNLPEERIYTGSSSVDLNIDDISISHEIVSTNNSDTGTGKFNISLNDLAIGEEVVYKTILTFPNSYSTGVTITQDLPNGFKFLSGSIDNTGLGHSGSGITINPDNTITYNLGSISNNGSGSNDIVVYSTAVVTNSGIISSGQELGLSTATAELSNGHTQSDTTNLDIVEPNLVVTKNYDIVSGNGGDTATTTITITNNGTAPAYDLFWNDVQDNKFTSGTGYVNSSGATILNVGDTITYTYDTVLDDTVVDGETLSGSINVNYSSSPLVNSNERNYISSGSDNINVFLTGSLQTTLDTNNTVKIGDSSSYTIKVKIGEGTTNSLKLEDLFDNGIAINTSSIVVTPDSGVTYSGSVQPNISGTGMTWNFTDIVNSNSNNSVDDFITITFDTVLLNTTENNIGNTKSHNVKATFNGTDIKNSSPNDIVVIEPNISLNISNTYDQLNQKVKYTYNLTNNGTATGYNLNLSNLLPSGVSYTGAINITNAGGSTNLVKTGDNFTISELPVNTGNPLTFEIYADINDNHNLGDNLTLTGNLDYTSQSGSYTSIISGNSDNTERNGNGGINDYKTSDNTLFIYQDAILNESISVVDDNGGDNLGTEDYTYTVTLTNTGNVDLTSIPVSIDIPQYLRGSTFILQSIPGGASSSYSSTGGVINNGKLDVSGINISVGQSKTIVYKIKSNKNIPDGTNISTVAVVGDSPEGAVGGNPSVNILIKAPILSSTSEIIDDNGGNLFLDEILTHKSSFTNTGSVPAVNSQVVLTYNTGTTSYISGSLDFGTGVLVDNNSIVIDEINGTISFLVTQLDPNSTADFSFKTKVIGNVGTVESSKIFVLEEKGYNTETNSNEVPVINKVLDLDEDINVVDNNGGNHLSGETYTYTVTLTNSGNIDLTGIYTSIDIPDYLSGSTFAIQSIPTGSNSTYSSTGGIDLNGKLDVTGISIPFGESRTIVYTLKTNIDTPDTTNINTTANVSDAIEGAIGGTAEVDFTVDSPVLQVSSQEIDDNGIYLYEDDTITHLNKIKNNGSYISSDMDVVLTYDSNTVDYIPGSLSFGTGTNIDTNSIVIDDTLGTISFKIIDIDPSEENSIEFKTKATGNIGDTVETNISAIDSKGYSSQNNSNELKIEKPILNEVISVVDDNLGDHLGGENYTYTVTLTNSGTVDLTNIPVSIEIPNYFSGATFSLQSIPDGSVSNYNIANKKLDVTGINIAIGETKTIVYKIKSDLLTPDQTTINTIANVGNTPELAIGGNPSVNILIKAPILSSTSEIIDDNGGNLFLNETLTNKSSFTNTGSVPAINSQVVLTYNTGTTSYISGSLDFGTGVLVDNNSIVIDEINGTISFLVTQLDPNSTADFSFKTKVIGNPYKTFSTKINVIEDRGFITNSLSDELQIMRRSSGSSSKSKSTIINDQENTTTENTTTEDNNTTENTTTENITTEDNNKEENTTTEDNNKILEQKILSLKSEYDKILLKEKLLNKLLKEEDNTQNKGFILPKILPQTGTPIEERTFRRNVSSIEVSLPNKEVFRLAGSNNSNLDFWKQVLPEQDRDREEYVVIPSNGLVVPVNKVPDTTTDFVQIISGNEINFNKYLKTGAMEYPNSGELGKKGNKIILGHSSYWKNDDGRYKTNFGKIIELDSGEEVWVYKKINGKFVRYRYIVEKSFDTNPTNVGVLKQTTDDSILTLFTCTPIGGIKGRWIIQARYVNEKKKILENELYGNAISSKYRRAIYRLIEKIKNLDSYKRKEVIIKLIDRIDSILLKIKNKKIINILNYLKLRLLKELFEY